MNNTFADVVIRASLTIRLTSLELNTRENLLRIVVNVTGLSVSESDYLPRKICRNCYIRLKQFSEFKDLCQKSCTQQEKFS